MPIRIATDSASDLPIDLAKEYGIAVVPCYINLDGYSYQDGVQLSPDQFYEKLPTLKSPPTSSAPGAGAFVNVYRRLADEGANEILSIHLAGTLSNIPGIARVAADLCDGIPVTVIDGGQLSLGTGFLALAAARAAKEGQSCQDIMRLIQEQCARTYAFAALDGLEALRRSGRVSMIKSSLGNLLHIKPVLKIHEGKVTVERVRSRSKAAARLVDFAKSLQPVETMAVLHTHAPQEALSLMEQVEPYFTGGEQGEIIFVEASTLLGVHLGSGAIGCVCIRQKV